MTLTNPDVYLSIQAWRAHVHASRGDPAETVSEDGNVKRIVVV